jgi:phosphoglycerate dehydrogenase-like enzyme
LSTVESLYDLGAASTIDERSLYEALKDRRIAGAVIDTWYSYPSPNQPSVLPSKFPFHELPNVVMTPHMSGWTAGTINRRRQTIADNISRRAAGRPCVNVVRPART